MIFSKKIFSILLLCFFLIFGVFLFLLGTNFGANLIFTKIMNRIPGLSFESISGSWGNFNINGVVYENVLIGIIKIDKCNLSINLRSILLKKIYIKYICLNNIIIHTNVFNLINNKSKNIKNNKNIKNFVNPYSIICKDIRLNNIYAISDNIECKIQRLNTSLVFQNNLLQILPIYISEGSILCKFFIGKIVKKGVDKKIYSMCYIKYASYIKDILRSLVNDKLIMNFKNKDSLNCIFTDIQGKNLRICFNSKNNWHVINNFQSMFSWNKEMMKVQLYIDLMTGYFNGIGNIIFQNCYPVYFTAKYTKYNSIVNCNDRLEKKLSKINLVITGSLIDELCIDCNIAYFISTAHIILKMKLMDINIPIKLFIHGDKVPTFFLGNSRFILKKLNFSMIGQIDDYQIYAQFKLINSKIATIYASMNAKGNVNNCIISKSKMKFLNGYCEMRSTVNWNDVISWNSTFDFNKIEIFQKYLKYPIKLSGRIITEGYLCFNSWKIAIPQFNIKSDIKGHNVLYSGSLCIKPSGQWKISKFRMNWDSNVLEVKGEIQKNHALNFVLKFNIIDYSIFSSELSGNLSGYCKLYGFVNAPIILLKIDTRSVDYKNKNIYISNMCIDSNIYFNKLIQSNFFLKADQIKYKNSFFHMLVIIGSGNYLKHYFNVIIKGNELFGRINFFGKFDSKFQIWSGKINQTKIITPIGIWQLVKDLDFIYQHSSQKIIIKEHFWENNCCQIVVTDLFWKKKLEKINTVLKSFYFESLDLNIIEIIKLYNIRLYCSKLCWDIGNLIPKQGYITLSGTQLDIISSLNTIKSASVKIKNINFRLISNQTNLFFNGTVKINHDKGYVKILITDVYNAPKVKGSIYMNNIELVTLSQLLFKSKELLTGSVNINLNFSGYLINPKIYGVIQLKVFNFNKPDTFLYIKDSFLKIRFLGEYAVLDGMINTVYGGQLYLDGNLTHFRSINDINLVLKIQGNQVNIHLSPTIYTKMSPNFVCIITKDQINIQGNIDIPWAYIECQEFSKNTVDISSEEILLDDQYHPILNSSKNLGIFVISNLILRFGDDVHFNGWGLYAKLKGDLDISYSKNELNIIGQIKTCSGYFKAYGKNLTINRGQLLFSGIINHAYLDVEVVRNSLISSSSMKNSIIPGIRITGMLDQLKLEFFSNSVLLSQQEIASYLLNEYNLILSTSSNIINNKIISLLVGVSIKRYEKFINKIGKVLGVQELTLNTQDFGSDSLIALSGYIAPGLQIKYGISAFDLLNTVTISYSINNKLFLEATSNGYNQALDLLYKFDY